MRILFITNNLPGRGGIETVLTSTLNELRKRGINCHIYMIANSKKEASRGIETDWLKDISYSKEEHSTKNKLLIVAIHAIKLSRYLRKQNFDAVISIDGRGIIIAKLAFIIAWRRPQLFSWVHRNLPSVRMNRFVTLADHHLAISNGIARQLHEKGEPNNKIDVIYNPTSETFSTIPFDNKNFLYLGSLIDSKGVGDIIEAASRLSGEWKIHIFGSGREEGKYRHRIDTLELTDRFVFHGHMKQPWSFIAKEIRSVAALILASKSESFGMVLVEAASHGVYCISSDCETGPVDIINDSNGTLFPVGDTKALSNCMQSIIDSSITPNQSLIKNSAARFEPTKYIEGFLNAIDHQEASPKLLFITPNLSGLGGTESVTRTVIMALRSKWGNSHIYIIGNIKKANKGKNNECWLEDIPHTTAPSGIRRRYFQIIFHAWKLSKFLKLNRIDHIIATDGRSVIIAKLALFLARKNIPIISWIHLPVYRTRMGRHLKYSNHHFAISSGIADQISALGITREKISTIYNPIKSNLGTIPFYSPNIIFLGRLNESHKRIKDIIEASSKLKGNWKLHLLGSGPDEKMYKTMVNNLGLTENIIFHGHQPNAWDYIQKNLNGVGALVLASQREGFPMVLAEAMSHGVYCISSDCETGPRDIIKDGVNGTLFPVGDVPALATAMQQVIDSKETFDQQKIQQSVQHLELENYIKQFINTLENL